MAKQTEASHVEDALVVQQGPVTVMPVVSGAEFAASFRSYKELQQAIDQSMPEEIITVGGKPYRKKGYWKALRAAFNLTVECVHDERVEVTLEDGSIDWGWHVRYRASTSSGAFVDGDGSCFSSEKSRGSMLATEHNVRAHAHTRASNRAISSLVGFGEVTYDEMVAESQPARSPVHPTPKPSPVDDSHNPSENAAPVDAKPPSIKRFTEDGTRLISTKQSGKFHAVKKAHGRSDEVCKYYLKQCFESERTEDIPFGEFQDVLKWLEDDARYAASVAGMPSS